MRRLVHTRRSDLGEVTFIFAPGKLADTVQTGSPPLQLGLPTFKLPYRNHLAGSALTTLRTGHISMDKWFLISNESDVSTPSVLLYPDRISQNITRMIQVVGGDPSRLCPHVKTHKLAQVLRLQIDQGINRFKCSTIAECEMSAAAGANQVLMAYPLLGPNVERFLKLQRLFPRTSFAAVTDNLTAFSTAANVAAAAGESITFLMDINAGMNRTGILPDQSAFALYRSLSQATGAKAGGLHIYDGHLHQSDEATRRAAWQAAIQPVLKLREQLEAAGLAVPRLVCGGTPTMAFWAGVPGVECSAGTPVLYDFGQPNNNPELSFFPAAVIVTRVISKPNAETVCLDLGHKAIASEMPHPRVRFFGLEAAEYLTHSEEHMVIRHPDCGPLAIGQMIYGLPKHICPTMALHQSVGVVRNGLCSDYWEVVARARKITV